MRRILTSAVLLAFLLCGSVAYAFISGSTGADGAFSPLSDTQLQIPDSGVFNFTTVNIPLGVTVTFIKNAANTPVYILATGDVTIGGTLSVSGGNAVSITAGAGGPGGFDGGYGGDASKGGNGLGPGGGSMSGSSNTGLQAGGGGGYGSAGVTYGGGPGGSVYGEDFIIPFIGGSGGAGGNYSSVCGDFWAYGRAGGGGGGAILIASSGTISVTGSILANGGAGYRSVNTGGQGDMGCYSVAYSSGGGGSGGAIKLIADTIAGNGTISAAGGSGGYGNGGGNGRIRIEANTVTRTVPSIPAYIFSAPGSVFIANIPTIQITSIAGVNVPQSPTGAYGTPDVTLPAGTINPVTVGISASNIPTGTVVNVTVVPQLGAGSTYTSTGLNGTQQSSTATAGVNLSFTAPCVLMAEATFNIQTAMNYDGEKITQASVATSMGGGSRVTYITASGKRVPAAKLYASLIK
jgi:hypothetical protein